MRRDNRLKTTVSDGVAADVAEIADEADKSVAEVVRQAIREYTDHDRTARIEERIGRIEDKVDALARGDTPGSDDADHTHTNSDGMCDTGGSGGARSVAAKRTREIVRWIHENMNGEALKDKQVSKAIWTFAGDDPRTVRKYKDRLRSRGLLFEHPGDPPLWTTETSLWRRWLGDLRGLSGQTAVEEFLEPYPAHLDNSGDSPTIALNSDEIEAGGDAQ